MQKVCLFLRFVTVVLPKFCQSAELSGAACELLAAIIFVLASFFNHLVSVFIGAGFGIRMDV